MAIRVGIRHLCVVVLGMLQSLTATSPRAAEWSMVPAVDLRTEYNDNIALTTAAHPSVWGVILSPDVKFSGTTEALNVTGGLRLNFNTYFGESGLDTTDHFLILRSSYKTERDTLVLNVDSIRDSTLLTELAETGVVLTRDQRNRLLVNPSWSRNLTEATAISANYSYTDVRYANTAGTGLIDYRDQGASVGLQSKLSERDVASVTAYFDRYETSPALTTANTYGIQAGYDRDFSERLHGTLVVGVRNTRGTTTSQTLVCDGPIILGICFGNVTPTTSVTSGSSTGYTLLANVENKWETALVNARLSRDLNPSGVGTLVQTDRLGVGWTQQWSPALSSSISAAAYHTRYLGGFVTASDNRYYRIEPRMSWKITEWWTLSAGYSYSYVSYQSSPATASANVAYVVLSYVWPKLAVSR